MPCDPAPCESSSAGSGSERAEFRLRLTVQLDHGGHNVFGPHKAKTVVVPLRADTLVAVLAGNVVEEHPVRNAPGSMLRVGQRVEVYHRRTNCRGDVHGTRIVRHQQRRALDQGGQVGQVKLARQRDGRRTSMPWQIASTASRSDRSPVNTTRKP